jgi:hypothetical protein
MCTGCPSTMIRGCSTDSLGTGGQNLQSWNSPLLIAPGVHKPVPEHCSEILRRRAAFESSTGLQPPDVEDSFERFRTTVFVRSQVGKIHVRLRLVHNRVRIFNELPLRLNRGYCGYFPHNVSASKNEAPPIALLTKHRWGGGGRPQSRAEEPEIDPTSQPP